MVLERQIFLQKEGRYSVSSKQWITCVIVAALAVSLELALAFRSPV